MLPIIGLFSAKISSVIGIISGATSSRYISKWVTDRLISGKIGEIVREVEQKIGEWYLDYRRNIHITLILNFLIVGITIIWHFFFTINDIIICIISSICIFMIIRAIARLIKFIVETIIPYWVDIVFYTRVFFRDLFAGYGISGSITKTIKYIIYGRFLKHYYENTNSFTRGLHTVFSKLRFVKSQDEISEDVQDELCSLITGYTVRLMIYKIIAFIIYILVFNYLLRPFLFSYALKLNILQVIFYPFTVAIPKVIMIIKGG